MFSSSF